MAFIYLSTHKLVFFLSHLFLFLICTFSPFLPFLPFPPFLPISHSICSFSSENLFGNYLDKAMFLEKNGLSSYEEPDVLPTNTNRYVLADITTFFTLLVGIYFPSVTGLSTSCRPHTHIPQCPVFQGCHTDMLTWLIVDESTSSEL